MPLVATAFPRRAAAIAALAALLPLVGACASRVDTTGSIQPDDYRDRHPIVLQDGPRVLDLFVEGPQGTVARGRQDLADFLAEYRRYGSGVMLVQVPVGFGTHPATRGALATVQSAGGRMSVSSYQPTDPKAASPIRLTFRRLKAAVTSQCGLWPQDLGVSDAGFAWRNQQYWNFGCAYQSNFASQVADPVDLVRGRHETPPDTGRRMYNFGQVRQGTDPSTSWKDPQLGASVNQGVSN